MSLARRLARLHRVRAGQLALVPLSHDPSSARTCRQGSSEWFEARHGRLTASRFADVLGMRGQSFRRAAIANLQTSAPDVVGTIGDAAGWAEPGYSSADDATLDDISGRSWGHRFERSALATYLHCYVTPRCAGARVLETGFWPIDTFGGASVALGASPDGLLDGADAVWPGGVVVECKCPWSGGVPRPQGKVHARQVPQLQGALLATGRAMSHLVTWSPSGASVFACAADRAFQEAMVEVMGIVVAAAADERPLERAEETRAAEVKAWSRRLALEARLLASIEPRHCLVVVDDG